MLLAASVFMALAVIFGALGAHALEMVLNQMQIKSFETGVRYQAWHALAIFIVQLIPLEFITQKAKKTVSILFILGIVCFSFSIYLLNLRHLLNIPAVKDVVGPITPVGGLFFIAGWVVLAIAIARRKSVK